MDDKLSIRVNVADRYYPLKVERENEEKIRKAARMINEKVLQYKQRYTDKDVQDFLAMAALRSGRLPYFYSSSSGSMPVGSNS